MSSKSSRRTEPRPDPAGRAAARREPLVGPSGERLLAIGEIVGIHGIRGEMRMRPFNPDSSVLGDVEEVMLVDESGGMQSTRPERVRPHGGVWLLQLEGVTTPERARDSIGTRVAVREDELPALDRGQFYCFQLVGLAVVDESGAALGTVADVLAHPGNDVLVVQKGGRERLIPMVDRVIGAVDLEGRKIVVHPIDGLLD